MSAAPSTLRPVPPDSSRKAAPTQTEPAAPREKDSPTAAGLTWLARLLGCLVFLAWLALFGGGILIDSEPYRVRISAEGAMALKASGAPPPRIKAGAGSADGVTLAAPPPPPTIAEAASVKLITAWFVVLTCFLPLNLAWLCVVSSALGAFGNIANLGPDGTINESADTSNPYMSALLRGFFIYLFMMSGLLVLDDAPFSNAGPSQYIRLAGFLSLFSFVVSYQPRFFGTLIVSALQRIQVKSGETSSEITTRVETEMHHEEVKRETSTGGT